MQRMTSPAGHIFTTRRYKRQSSEAFLCNATEAQAFHYLPKKEHPGRWLAAIILGLVLIALFGCAKNQPQPMPVSQGRLRQGRLRQGRFRDLGGCQHYHLPQGNQMSNDRELLEMAAKAVGGRFTNENRSSTWQTNFLTIYQRTPKGVEYGPPLFDKPWNPLDEDGDAFRLAVRLSIVLSPSKQTIIAWVPGSVDRDKVCVILQPDPESATRRAIVLAAAEIGRQMP